MISKIFHYLKRYLYRRCHRIMPPIPGGSGAYGQDILVANLLGNKRGGIFFDIGANDGITISNTYYLEKDLGWSGVAIEPIPSVFERLKANRDCTLVNGCVTPAPGTRRFVEIVGAPNMLSTLATNNTGLTARRLRHNISRHKATMREIQVSSYTFSDLMDSNGITSIDFLSLDTEGGELDILKSIDFERHSIKIISVENNYFSPKISELLVSKGYLQLGTFGVDEIYIYGGKGLALAMAGS